MRAKRQRSSQETGRQVECPYRLAGKASALGAGSDIPKAAYSTTQTELCDDPPNPPSPAAYSNRALTKEQEEAGLSRQTLAMLTTISFLLGAVCSAASGYVGMWVGTLITEP